MPAPFRVSGGMRRRALSGWVAVGAVVGGLLVGSFDLEPSWVWGMAGGAAGGAVGAAAGYVASLRWKWPLRTLVAVFILLAGFLTLWMAASAQFLRDAIQAVGG